MTSGMVDVDAERGGPVVYRGMGWSMTETKHRV